MSQHTRGGWRAIDNSESCYHRTKTIQRRRAKHCQLKDVAGMLRSFDYAPHAILFEMWEGRSLDESQRVHMEKWVLAWEQLAERAFLQGYFEAAAGIPARALCLPTM